MDFACCIEENITCIHFICRFHQFYGIHVSSFLSCSPLAVQPISRDAGKCDCFSDCLVLVTMYGAMQMAKWQYRYARFSTQPTDELKIGQSMLQNKLRHVQNTGTCCPRPLLPVSQVQRGIRPAASAHVPDKNRLGLGYRVPVFCTNLNLYNEALCYVNHSYLNHLGINLDVIQLFVHSDYHLPFMGLIAEDLSGTINHIKTVCLILS